MAPRFEHVSKPACILASFPFRRRLPSVAALVNRTEMMAATANVRLARHPATSGSQNVAALAVCERREVA